MAYTRIKGTDCKTTADKLIVQTVGVATSESDTGVPKRGDSLSTPPISTTLPPLCEGRNTTDKSEPGRILIFSTWTAPITHAEAHP